MKIPQCEIAQGKSGDKEQINVPDRANWNGEKNCRQREGKHGQSRINLNEICFSDSWKHRQIEVQTDRQIERQTNYQNTF